MHDDCSVVVQNIVKSYGKHQILRELSMKVETGQIYGLLGSSGCGKTTLLGTIVGRKKIESGDIWVLGGRPGSPGSGIPGPKVGYMPQEISLVREFTVKDAIFYFGRIFQMKEELIEERYKELSDLLNLPPDNRYLKDCSGGQQRRVSFAVALVHKPKLLILDEPTVGIDPLLREKIWSYLVTITKQENLSVIITTHYIEECRQADKIGLMREGRLLTEDSPKNLLQKFNTDTLEEVFLILSQKQDAGKLLESKEKSVSSLAIDGSTTTLTPLCNAEDSTRKKEKSLTKARNHKCEIINTKRLKALLNKNAKQFFRNITGLLFVILIPVVQIILLKYCLGTDMINIPIGIVNDESMELSCPGFSLNKSVYSNKTSLDCYFNNLSCRFLKHHLNDPMIKKVEYESLEKAVEDVTHGIVYGVIYFPQNYTESYKVRFEDSNDASNEVLDFSEIKVRLDMSNQQIGTNIKGKLIDLYIDFQKLIYKDCNYPPKAADIPVVPEYLYGSRKEPYQIFIIPGTIITMMFFLGATLTSQTMISEKHEGIWDRSIVAGVTALELTVSHLLFQSCVIIFQSLEFLLIVYVIYQYVHVGSIYLMFLIVYLQGICGMSYGYFISVVCSNITMSSNAVMGLYLPLINISGVIWPLEGMPTALQWFSKLLPASIPIEALNNVVKKGLTITNLKVVSGIGVSLIWILIFCLISILLLKMQR